mgnify:CR=1 FL=1
MWGGGEVENVMWGEVENVMWGEVVFIVTMINTINDKTMPVTLVVMQPSPELTSSLSLPSDAAIVYSGRVSYKRDCGLPRPDTTLLL